MRWCMRIWGQRRPGELRRGLVVLASWVHGGQAGLAPGARGAAEGMPSGMVLEPTMEGG